MALFHFNRIQDDEYLVKWKDWPAWTCSWEPEAHLSDELIRLAIVTFRGLALHRKKTSEKLFECTRKNDE